MESRRAVRTFYTGGTISSLPNFQGVREPGNVDLLKELRNVLYRKEQSLPSTLIFRVPQTIYRGLSENITKEKQQQIIDVVGRAIQEEKDVGILITFGTDSMIQTARALNESLKQTAEERGTTIAITGANEDTTHPKTDAWDNLMLAVKTLEKPLNKGKILICFGGKEVDPLRACMLPYDGKSMKIRDKKMHAYECLQGEDKRNRRREKAIIKFAKCQEVFLYHTNTNERENHTEILEAVSRGEVQVIVFVLYHSGTANVEDECTSVSKLVQRVTEQGVFCFGASENGEKVTLKNYITSQRLGEAGLRSLGSMDYICALTLFTSMVLEGCSSEMMIDKIANHVCEVEN